MGEVVVGLNLGALLPLFGGESLGKE
jgi:hypothetical protein